MENNFVTFLKRDVEIRSVKNLPEFFLHRTQNFLLIEPRTDRLANLRQQLGLLGLALRIVHDHVIFERETNLQSQADQQPQVRSAKQVAFRMWKQQHSEVMLTGLQTYGGNVANVLCRHCSLSELCRSIWRLAGRAPVWDARADHGLHRSLQTHRSTANSHRRKRRLDSCGALPETDRSPASWVSGTDQGLSGGSPLVRQRQASQVRRGTDQHKFTHRAWSDDRRGSRGVGRQHSRGLRVFRSAPQAKAKLTTPRYPTAGAH